MKKLLITVLLLVCLAGFGSAQTPGVATAIIHGGVLPANAPIWTVFLVTDGSGFYVCTNNPCTSAGQWVNTGYLNPSTFPGVVNVAGLLNAQGNAAVAGVLNAQGAVNIGGVLTATGTANFNGVVNTGVTQPGSAVNTNGPVNVSGSLTFPAWGLFPDPSGLCPLMVQTGQVQLCVIDDPYTNGNDLVYNGLIGNFNQFVALNDQLPSAQQAGNVPRVNPSTGGFNYTSDVSVSLGTSLPLLGLSAANGSFIGDVNSNACTFSRVAVSLPLENMNCGNLNGTSAIINTTGSVTYIYGNPINVGVKPVANQTVQAPTGGFIITSTSTQMVGKLITIPSVTGGAGFNCPAGVAPTSPVNGDVWCTTAGMFLRTNGVTQGPFGAGVGTVGSLDQITGAAAVATATEVAAGDVYTYAGVETGALTVPIVFTNANSSNSNSSGTVIIQTTGTSSGAVPLRLNQATVASNLLEGYTGATVTAGVLAGGTLKFSIDFAGGFHSPGAGGYSATTSSGNTNFACGIDSGSVSGCVGTFRGADHTGATGSETAGIAIVRGGNNASTVANANVVAGNASLIAGMLSGATPSALASEGNLVVAGAYKGAGTLNTLACPSTTAWTEVTCSSAANNINWTGVIQATTGGSQAVEFLGDVLLTFDASITAVAGDIVCVSYTTAGDVYDAGTTPCPVSAAYVGRVKFQLAPATTALVTLDQRPQFLTEQLLTSAYTNSTNAVTTITSFGVIPNATYSIRCHGLWKAATSGQFALSLSGPVSPTLVTYDFNKCNTISANVCSNLDYNATGAIYPSGLGPVAVGTAATDMPFDLTVGFTNGSTAGTFILQGFTVAGDQLTVEAGSTCIEN